MKAYKTTVEVKTKWAIEVHAETKEDAEQTVERMALHEIEAGGDFDGLESTEVVDIEEMYPPEDEEDKGVDPVEGMDMADLDTEPLEPEPEDKDDRTT